MKGKKRNAIQWLYGETNEVELPVLKDKANECNEIAVGDPVCVRMGTRNAGNRWYARPASAFVNASIGDASAMFAGICMSKSQDGDQLKIRVATTGVFEVPCASATLYAGYFATWKTGTSSVDADACTPAAPTGDYVHAFGTLVDGGTAQTTAKVKIVSRLAYTASLDTTRGLTV